MFAFVVATGEAAAIWAYPWALGGFGMVVNVAALVHGDAIPRRG